MRTFFDSLQRAIDNAPSPEVKAALQAVMDRVIADKAALP